MFRRFRLRKAINVNDVANVGALLEKSWLITADIIACQSRIQRNFRNLTRKFLDWKRFLIFEKKFCGVVIGHESEPRCLVAAGGRDLLTPSPFP